MSNISNANNIIKWGIIGCGKVTEIKSGPAYKNTQGFELAAVMRRSLDEVQDYAKRHEITKYYVDADALINDDDIDAVYIATPPDTHRHYALKVAEVGKPCCIEKPMTSSYTDSLAIYEAFKEKEIPLFVAYYRRSLPRFKQVKSWLDNNYIGEVRHINWHLSKPANDLDLNKLKNWRTEIEIAPGGYFDDLASHGLNLFTHFFGNVKDAKGVSVNQQNLYSAKDAVVANWQHENGITGTGCWNFGCNAHIDEVKIYGSKGTIEFSMFHEKPISIKSESITEELFIDNPVHIQTPHVEGMRDMLINKDYTHPSTGGSALHTNWVMDKILGNL